MKRRRRHCGGCHVFPRGRSIEDREAHIVLVYIKRGSAMFMRSFIILAAGLLLAPAAATAQGINDAQIAAIVVTANQVDIDAGKLAVSQSTNDKVKAFAQLMVTDHTGVNKAAVELATRLKVTPQASPTSEALKAGGEKNLAHLK